MSYVNFNRALTRAQIEALGDSVDNKATNGKIYFAKDGGIYVGNPEGRAERKADYTPLLEKKFDPYTCTANTEDAARLGLFKVIPDSDNWYQPWVVKYQLIVDTTYNPCQGVFDCQIGQAGSQSPYSFFNNIYSTSYIPVYQHDLYYQNSKAQFDSYNKDHPAIVGVRVYSGYNVTTLPRTFTVKILEMTGCKVEFFDTPQPQSAFYSTTYYTLASITAYINGLQETGDSNTPPNQYFETYGYYYIHSTETPLYRYKICGFDSENRLVPTTITDQTSSTMVQKTPCPVAMDVSRGLVLYNTTTAITNTTTATGTSTIYRGYSGANHFVYTFNEWTATSGFYYFCGYYNKTNGLFTLDTTSTSSYFVHAPYDPDSYIFSDYFTQGKYYWLVGRNQSTFNSQFYLENPLYYCDGEKLIPVENYIANTTGATDTSNKIYLEGAPTQTADPQTYSDDEVYTTSGVLTTKSVQVGGGAATIQYDSTNACIKFIFN